MSEDDISKQITRRRFIFRLGATGIAISGWIMMPEAVRRIAGALSQESGPALREGLAVRHVDGGAEICEGGGFGKGRTVCEVNDVGRLVLDGMNGRSSVHTIVKDLSSKLGVSKADMRVFTAGIVLFIAELAESGLLRGRFYANIYARETAT